jgi:spermidine/putrescine transport system permease protein
MRQLGNRYVARSLGIGVLGFLYAPLAVMAVFSFNDSNYTGLPFNAFTVRWYGVLFHHEQILASIVNSVYVAIGVVGLGLLFGLPAAIALDRYSFPGKEAFRRIVLLPIALPGVITGVSLLLFYMAIGMKLSLNTIILGQGTGLMCVTITEVFARLQQLGRSQEEAARNLGATEFEVLVRVVLPNIKSALIGAALITFSISFDEIAVTYLLTGRSNTLPMTLWSMLRRSVTPEINAVSTLVIVVSVVLVVIGIRASRGTDTGRI